MTRAPTTSTPRSSQRGSDSNAGKYDVEFRLYEAYKNKINHEDDLLHQRTTALMQVQGILLGVAAAGFWLVVKSDPSKDRQSISDIKGLISIIGTIGIAFSMAYFFPIKSAVSSIKGLEKNWSDIVEEAKNPDNARNKDRKENKLDKFILMDLPRLTTNMTDSVIDDEKHRIKKLSSLIGGWCAIAAPLFCLVFWVLVIYNNVGGFPFVVSPVDGGIIIRSR